MSNFVTQLLLGGVVGGTLSYTMSQNIAKSTEEIRSNLSKLVQSVQEGSAVLSNTPANGTDRLALSEHVKSRVSDFSLDSVLGSSIAGLRDTVQWNDQIAVIASTDYQGLLANTFQQLKTQLTPKSSSS